MLSPRHLNYEKRCDNLSTFFLLYLFCLKRKYDYLRRAKSAPYSKLWQVMASRILIWDYGVFECCYEWPDRKSEVEKLENESKRQTVQIALESIWLGGKGKI